MISRCSVVQLSAILHDPLLFACLPHLSKIEGVWLYLTLLRFVRPCEEKRKWFVAKIHLQSGDMVL